MDRPDDVRKNETPTMPRKRSFPEEQPRKRSFPEEQEVDVPIGLVCRKGDVRLLEYLIKNGRKVCYGDDRRWFPIHEAAAALQHECCDVLLKTGTLGNSHF